MRSGSISSSVRPSSHWKCHWSVTTLARNQSSSAGSSISFSNRWRRFQSNRTLPISNTTACGGTDGASGMQKAPDFSEALLVIAAAKDRGQRGSTLTRLEAAVGLVDHVDPAAAPDHAVVPVTVLERLQAVDDLHGGSSKQERHQDAPVPDFVAAPYAGRPDESSAPQVGELALPGQSMNHDLLQLRVPRLPG